MAEQMTDPEVSGQDNKNRKKKGRLGSTIFIIVDVAILAFCLYKIIPDLVSYRKAEKGYDTLVENTITVPKESAGGEGDEGKEGADAYAAADANADADAAADADANAEANANADPKDLPPVGRSKGYYPELTIDYQTLADTNSDFVGVLYVPVLDIVYPVAHSHDNDEYLTRTFYGDYNRAGSIFMDRYSSADYGDRNTFILGHNMKDQSMFGKLKLFEQNEKLCDQDPYFYIYNEDVVRKYRIFSYYEVGVNEDLYDPDLQFADDDVYDAFIDEARARSHYRTEDDFDFTKRPDVVTLSTCWATDHVDNLVVHGVLEEVFE